MLPESLETLDSEWVLPDDLKGLTFRSRHSEFAYSCEPQVVYLPASRASPSTLVAAIRLLNPPGLKHLTLGCQCRRFLLRQQELPECLDNLKSENTNYAPLEEDLQLPNLTSLDWRNWISFRL